MRQNNLIWRLALSFFLQREVLSFTLLQAIRNGSCLIPSLSWSSKSQYQYSGTRRYSRDWIDEVEKYISDDDDDESRNRPTSPDMKYLPRNVMRQHQNFVAIRQAGGKQLTNDVYIREPQKKSQVYWFVGKIARVSDVTPAQAVARQWSLIETHGTHLRPIELFPGRGSLEIWIAPGDSEMEVAYNNPDLILTQMNRQVEGAEAIKNSLVGFQGEIYQAGEEGFRTLRNADGTPAKPPIQSPPADEYDTPNSLNDEMIKMEELLQGQDISALYEEQQRRAGKPIDD